MAADENGAAVSQPSDLRRPFCRLQGRLAANLAAAGPLQCRYARPPFNGAAAVNCFLLSSSLLFLLAWFQTRTGIIQKLQFSICICYIGAADAGWH